MLVGKSLTSVRLTGPTVRVAVLVVLPAVAEMVTSVGEATGYVLTAMLAKCCPPGTVIEAGTVAAAGLSLARDTTVPPAGATEVRNSVPETVAPPPAFG
jgi:hypothetical protein